jgi:hypothetical protein
MIFLGGCCFICYICAKAKVMNGLNQDTELNKIPENEMVYAQNSGMSNALTMLFVRDIISGGYAGHFLQIPGIVAEGNTIPEVIKALGSALESIYPYLNSK